MTSKSKSLLVVVILVLVGLTIAYLLPVYVMMITSVKSIPEVQAANYLVPSLDPQWKHFSDVLFGSPVFPTEMISRLINSIIITVSVTLLSAFIGGLAGYYLARNRSTFARTLYVLVGIALYLMGFHKSDWNKIVRIVIGPSPMKNAYLNILKKKLFSN